MDDPNLVISEEDIRKYNNEILPRLDNIFPHYTIVAKLFKSHMRGGQNIEFGIYFSGIGIPNSNKLVLIWSSSEIIDASKSGIAKYSIKLNTVTIDNKQMVIPLSVIEEQELSPYGVVIFLDQGNFFPIPQRDARLASVALPHIMAERMHGYTYPVQISVPLKRKAKPGRYTVNIIFTYEINKIVSQSVEEIDFIITSWWDRNQAWIVTLGTVLAFLTLLTVIVTSIISIV